MTQPLSPEEKERRRLHRLLHPKPKRFSGKRKCLSLHCGRCAACRMRRRWATGDRPHGIKPTTWPPEKMARLRELAGTMDRREVARVLDAEFPFTATTAQSVAVYASRNGISLWPPGRSLTEIGLLLGVTVTRVRTWLELGWLSSFPYTFHAGPHQSSERVTDEALQHFIRQHADQYRPERVQGDSPLARLARTYAIGRTPRRFSKRHPSHRRPPAPLKPPDWLGRACPTCEMVTFARQQPSACRTCREPFAA